MHYQKQRKIVIHIKSKLTHEKTNIKIFKKKENRLCAQIPLQRLKEARHRKNKTLSIQNVFAFFFFFNFAWVCSPSSNFDQFSANTTEFIDVSFQLSF